MMDTGRQVRVEVCVDSLEHEASSIACFFVKVDLLCLGELQSDTGFAKTYLVGT